MNLSEPDWLELWRELVVEEAESKKAPSPERLYERFRKKTHERPDPLLDFVLKDIDAGDTVLDIGAGSGRWTIAIARTAREVTSVEPSEVMVNLLRQRIEENQLQNVKIQPVTWEKAAPEQHDIVVCAHGIYLSRDFAGFVRKMETYARKKCYLGVRLPPADGIIGELSLKIHGTRHDSPNAVIAYNALYMMGIYANVFIEEPIHHWTDANMEDALSRAKRHLHLEADSTHDGLISDTLKRRLTLQDGVYHWPDGMRGALLWWHPRAQVQ